MRTLPLTGTPSKPRCAIALVVRRESPRCSAAGAISLGKGRKSRGAIAASTALAQNVLTFVFSGSKELLHLQQV
jgi:hypothetical protein